MAVKKPICNYTGTKEELRAADTLAGPVDSLKSATTSVSVSAATAPATGQVLTATSGSTATWQTPATGDMVLASVQTNTGAKTFLNATLALRNFANTFSGVFYNAITAARTWTFPDKDGTVAMTSDILATDLTATGGTTAGPTINSSTGADVVIPSASATASGIVTTGAQTFAGTKTFVAPVLGTPTSGVLTNCTGTAAGLTAGTVITNANLTGEVTSVGNAATVPNATVIGKVLTGYVSGAGTVAATDTILGAINKLNGNDALKQTLANKDATGGYAGLTLFKINFKNAANTFTNFLTNATTAARTWTFPDKDGTVAMTSDIIGANTSSIVSSENLAAGDLVNIWNNTGTANVRKADATVAGKEAHGFVLSAVTSPAAATVYFEGSNTGVTGLTPGPQFLATTAGLCTTTAPSASGNVVQRVGFATSATNVNFQSQTPVGLA